MIEPPQKISHKIPHLPHNVRCNTRIVPWNVCDSRITALKKKKKNYREQKVIMELPLVLFENSLYDFMSFQTNWDDKNKMEARKSDIPPELVSVCPGVPSCVLLHLW